MYDVQTGVDNVNAKPKEKTTNMQLDYEYPQGQVSTPAAPPYLTV